MSFTIKLAPFFYREVQKACTEVQVYHLTWHRKLNKNHCLLFLLWYDETYSLSRHSGEGRNPE